MNCRLNLVGENRSGLWDVLGEVHRDTERLNLMDHKLDVGLVGIRVTEKYSRCGTTGNWNGS